MSDGGLRDPRFYAVFDGETYLAVMLSIRPGGVARVSLTSADGREPEGFAVPPGQHLPQREVAFAKLDRPYRVDSAVEPDVWGKFALAEAQDVREDEQDLPLPRRRRRTAG